MALNASNFFKAGGEETTGVKFSSSNPFRSCCLIALVSLSPALIPSPRDQWTEP